MKTCVMSLAYLDKSIFRMFLRRSRLFYNALVIQFEISGSLYEFYRTHKNAKIQDSSSYSVLALQQKSYRLFDCCVLKLVFHVPKFELKGARPRMFLYRYISVFTAYTKPVLLWTRISLPFTDYKSYKIFLQLTIHSKIQLCEMNKQKQGI